MYNRFENGIHPRENVLDILSAAKDHSSSLEDHVRLLEKVSNITHSVLVVVGYVCQTMYQYSVYSNYISYY